MVVKPNDFICTLELLTNQNVSKIHPSSSQAQTATSPTAVSKKQLQALKMFKCLFYHQQRDGMSKNYFTLTEPVAQMENVSLFQRCTLSSGIG